VYGFLGRNGAGKSITLQILSGVIQPHKGQISFHNEQSPFVKTSWKKRIGYVAQDPGFPHNVNGVQTAWFLSQLYPKWSNSRFIEMVSAFQLMCQHFSGHKVKQRYTAICSLQGTNSHWLSIAVPCCKRLQYIQTPPV
jgi:ABC-type multidrug transport system ATPase subunit